MKEPFRTIKIKIEIPNLTAEDVEDMLRWENEGGHLTNKPGMIDTETLPLPLKKDWIFEVKTTEIIIEDGELFLQTDINLLSLH